MCFAVLGRTGTCRLDGGGADSHCWGVEGGGKAASHCSSRPAWLGSLWASILGPCAEPSECEDQVPTGSQSHESLTAPQQPEQRGEALVSAGGGRCMGICRRRRMCVRARQAVAVITSCRARVSERPAALLAIFPLAVSEPLARYALSGCGLMPRLLLCRAQMMTNAALVRVTEPQDGTDGHRHGPAWQSTAPQSKHTKRTPHHHPPCAPPAPLAPRLQHPFALPSKLALADNAENGQSDVDAHCKTWATQVQSSGRKRRAPPIHNTSRFQALKGALNKPLNTLESLKVPKLCAQFQRYVRRSPVLRQTPRSDAALKDD
eukprot:9235351-Alexandrium_andersonii.AAC.1